MKKWLWLAVAVLIALLAYVAAGPFLTVRAIREAVKTGDTVKLEKQVDFPALRSSFKAQLADHLAREAGAHVDDGPLATFGIGLANTLMATAIDGLITPTGISAMMEGRRVWERANNEPFSPSGEEDPGASRPQVLQNPEYDFESLSRFTATVADQKGRPVVFVFSRSGLNWKLSEILLPK